MTAPFRIREANDSDLDEIEDLATRITGLSRDREREIVIDAVADHGCFVSTDESHHVVGYAILARRAFFGRDFVHLVAVSERHRRRGIGLALLDAILARCTTEAVFISTNESNAAMRSLLVRDGWTPSGTLTGIDDGDPEMIFWKHPSAAMK